MENSEKLMMLIFECHKKAKDLKEEIVAYYASQEPLAKEPPFLLERFNQYDEILIKIANAGGGESILQELRSKFVDQLVASDHFLKTKEKV